MKKIILLLYITVIFISCSNDNQKTSYRLSMEFDLGKNTVLFLKNDSIILRKDNKSQMLPFIPTYLIDSINNTLYFNNFKNSLVSFDLNTNKIINEFTFKENYNNKEKDCELTIDGDYIIFHSGKNLILFDKSLDNSFNVGEEIVLSKNYKEQINSIKLLKMNNDSISVQYESEFHKGTYLTFSKKINLTPTDSLLLLNHSMELVNSGQGVTNIK